MGGGDGQHDLPPCPSSYQPAYLTRSLDLPDLRLHLGTTSLRRCALRAAPSAPRAAFWRAGPRGSFRTPAPRSQARSERHGAPSAGSSSEGKAQPGARTCAGNHPTQPPAGPLTPRSEAE